MVLCPECDAEIDVDEGDVDEGDSLSCDECGADLKVISVSPLELESEEDEEEEEDEEVFSEDDDEEEEEEEDEDWKKAPGFFGEHEGEHNVSRKAITAALFLICLASALLSFDKKSAEEEKLRMVSGEVL